MFLCGLQLRCILLAMMALPGMSGLVRKGSFTNSLATSGNGRSPGYPTATAPTRSLVLDSLRGTYSFAYDTGNHKHQSFRIESRDETGKVTGRFGYVDPDGVLRITDYVADHRGYRAISSVRYNRVSPNPSLIGPIPSPIINEESRLKTLKVPFSTPLIAASLAQQKNDLLPESVNQN